MADAELSQAEADALLRMEKRRLDDDAVPFPAPGQNITVELRSTDNREKFLLDLWRSGTIRSKVRFQIRARQKVVLARLDLSETPHRNPGGEKLASPHLHLYREGDDDKQAIPAPTDWFTELDNINKTLADFMNYCNIIEPPQIQWGLPE